MENIQSRNPRQFLLRLWPEDLGNGEIEWRGKVQDIATGFSSYFRDWPGLVATIQKGLAQPRAVPESPHESKEQGGNSAQAETEPGVDLSG